MGEYIGKDSFLLVGKVSNANFIEKSNWPSTTTKANMGMKQNKEYKENMEPICVNRKQEHITSRKKLQFELIPFYYLFTHISTRFNEAMLNYQGFFFFF